MIRFPIFFYWAQVLTWTSFRNEKWNIEKTKRLDQFQTNPVHHLLSSLDATFTTCHAVHHMPRSRLTSSRHAMRFTTCSVHYMLSSRLARFTTNPVQDLQSSRIFRFTLAHFTNYPVYDLHSSWISQFKSCPCTRIVQFTVCPVQEWLSNLWVSPLTHDPIRHY